MRSLLVSFGVALFILSGCSRSSNNSTTSNSSSSSNSTGITSNIKSSSTPGAAKTKGDFSTPKAAVETFLKAGASGDVELLSQSFDADSPGEFRDLREKTASQKDLDSLAEFVEGAEVLGVKEDDDSAVVSVKFKERNEEIKMKRSAGGWKIVDF